MNRSAWPSTRRTFLQLATAGTAAWLPSRASEPSSSGKGSLRIERIQYLRLEGRRPAVGGINRQPMVTPGDVYKAPREGDFRDIPGKVTPVPIAYYYLRITAAGGLEGLYGPVDEDALFTIDRLLKSVVLGKEALPYSRIWDELFLARGLSRSGRSTMAAISALDNALWDLRGKFFKAPVCILLGGPTRAAVDVYASCKNYSQHPQDMERRIGELKQLGYRRFKYHFSYGPAHGKEGLRKNLALVENLRRAAGEDCDIMFDAYMSWNLDYALAWARQAEKYSPRFLEECFPPDRIDDYVRLRQATSIPVATGEHLYGRHDVLPYLKASAVSVLQCDPEWCGGVTEWARIAGMAATFGVEVIPHGQNLHAALHSAAAQPPLVAPMMEYLVSYMEYRHYFEKAVPRPVNGRIQAPQGWGFGIELDPSKIERQREVSWG